jgi:hypothetical protein
MTDSGNARPSLTRRGFLVAIDGEALPTIIISIT